MIRVSDYIADFIYKLGVSHVFMLSGGGSIYLDDGIACHPHLKEICVINEATAPMMAEAYSRLNGNIGVVCVTTGPGGTNAVTGVAEAWVDSAPVLVISGQVENKNTTSYSFIKNIRTLGCQELNIIDVVKSITKYSYIVFDPYDIRYHLEKAVYYAKSGRPGPVWIDVPLDVQAAMIDETFLKGFVPELLDIKTTDRDIDKIIEFLYNSKKPLVVIGQGVRQSGSIDDFKKFLDYLQIPVISSRLGQDILSFDHLCNFGHGGFKGSELTKKIMQEADFILSIGSRLSVPFIGSPVIFSKKSKLVVVNIDVVELLRRDINIDYHIHSDIKDFLLKLNNKIEIIDHSIINESYKEWLIYCTSQKKEKSLVNVEKLSDPIDLYHFVSRLDVLSSERNIFVSDAGSSYYVCGQSLSFSKGQREITSGAFASMGLSIALSIGCCVADPEAQVLTVTGDGSVEVNIQELKTLSYYNFNAKIFVINNGGYLSIRNTQDKLFDGRYINSTESPLNFKKIADAFNVPYFFIDSYKNIDLVVKEVMRFDGCALIEVLCDNKQKIHTQY